MLATQTYVATLSTTSAQECDLGLNQHTSLLFAFLDSDVPTQQTENPDCSGE